MWNLLKHSRAALSLLTVEDVRRRAETPVHFGLVADNAGAYGEMEEFLAPEEMGAEERRRTMEGVHRASDPEPPPQVDVVLYEPGLACPSGAYSYRRGANRETAAEILADKPALSLALARRYPVFRGPVVERILHEVSMENTMFAVAAAVPNILPSVIELPWAVGEFASDTAFLTANQARMALQIAAACGKPVGFVEQKFEMLGIVGGAFGWRTLARELVGHIPFGGGLIPKGAIAYAGTWLVGKGLERLYLTGTRPNRADRKALYEEALERGRRVARAVRAG